MFWRILDFVKELQEKHGEFSHILDVGSRNINGSVKDVLTGYQTFTGVDFIEGKDVDIVMNGHDIGDELPGGHYDLITCCETFEHDVEFWKTLDGMRKLLKAGGYLLITAPGINFFHHDFPSDYYRFTPEAFKDLFFKDYEDVNVVYYFDPNDPNVEKPNNSILGWGRKPRA